MRNFNEWLAVKLGNGLSSMPFFYFCVLIDLFELGPVISAHDPITWCTYISQTVIQLIALPILGAQQKISHTHHEKQSKKLDEILEHNKYHLAALQQIIARQLPVDKAVHNYGYSVGTKSGLSDQDLDTHNSNTGSVQGGGDKLHTKNPLKPT
jgi:hypothetical protein